MESRPFAGRRKSGAAARLEEDGIDLAGELGRHGGAVNPANVDGVRHGAIVASADPMPKPEKSGELRGKAYVLRT